MKILCKNSCVFENKHFSFSFRWPPLAVLFLFGLGRLRVWMRAEGAFGRGASEGARISVGLELIPPTLATLKTSTTRLSSSELR